VGVGGDEVRDADAAFANAIEEVAPVHLGFGEGAGDAEDHAFAVVSTDSNGYEGGAIPYHAIDTNLVVGGVDDEVEDFGERSGAPFFELCVEFTSEF